MTFYLHECIYLRVCVCVCFVVRVFTQAAHSRSDVKAITLFPFYEAQNADYSDVGKQQEQRYLNVFLQTASTL